MEYLIYYFLLGTVAGTLAGMLGIGGGLIIVPVMAWLLTQQDIAPDHIMHIAIGTSLATILLTANSSVWAHHKRGAVRWDVIKRMFPGLLLGTLIGSWLATVVSSDALKTIFGVFEILIALQMLFSRQPAAHRELPGTIGLTSSGGIIGSLATLLGMGGGAFAVPWFMWCNVDAKKAIATGAAIGLPIAFFGSIGYIVGGLGADNLPQYSTGYIYWPAFVGIVAASILFAPLGARLAHSLPSKTLKRIFSVVLLIIGIKMVM